MRKKATFRGKEIKRLLKEQPCFDDVYWASKSAKNQLQVLREKFSIKAHKNEKYIALLSFYLGVLEGFIKKMIKTDNLNEIDMVNLTISAAYFNALMDNEVDDENEGEVFMEELYEDYITQTGGTLSIHCSLLGLNYSKNETAKNHEHIFMQLQHLLE